MRIIFTLILSFLWLSHAAYANDSLYTVRDVSVDAVGVNATEAREKALARGQKDAFFRVIKRIAPQVDIASLMESSPELAAEEQASTIANMVSALDVHNESVTGKRYVAKLDIRFQPQYVQAFLRNNSISFTNNSQTAMLVLPVFFDNSQQPSFNANHSWTQIWTSVVKQHKNPLIQLVMVNANEPLLASINPATLLAKETDSDNLQAIQALLNHYNADQLLFAAGRLEGKETLVTMARIFGQNQPTSFSENIDVSSDKPIKLSMTEAVNQLVARVQGQQQALDSQLINSKQVEATLPLRGQQHWMQMKEILNRLDFIRSWSIREITSSQAVIELNLASDLQSLQRKFAENGLVLEQYDGKLYLNSAAAPTRRSPFNFFQGR